MLGLRKTVSDLRYSAEFLEDQLKLANKCVISREDLQSNEFDRPGNLEIIRVNAHRYVTKRSRDDALTPRAHRDGH